MSVSAMAMPKRDVGILLVQPNSFHFLDNSLASKSRRRKNKGRFGGAIFWTSDVASASGGVKVRRRSVAARFGEQTLSHRLCRGIDGPVLSVTIATVSALAESSLRQLHDLRQGLFCWDPPSRFEIHIESAIGEQVE